MNNYLIELYCAAEKTITVKGKAPVDNEYPSSSSVHVFYDDKDIWDCMLNQVCTRHVSFNIDFPFVCYYTQMLKSQLTI